MHELSITEHLLEDCIRNAEENHASRIRVIHLCIGQLRGIVPDCIQIYLDMLSEGTIAEGAQQNFHLSEFYAETAGKKERSLLTICSVPTAEVCG